MHSFVLGFKDLADLIPDLVGEPLEAEHHNPESGDTLPLTSTGLMVWRKADNWTAFTDGHRTWINGPFGLQQRLNEELFDWERGLWLPSPLIERWQSPNCWPGRPYGDPLAIVLHTAAGSEEGMEAWFANPRSQVSAHFGANLDGDLDAYVDLGDRAWHAGKPEAGHRWFYVYRGPQDGRRENPNNWTVGIETEDLGDPRTPVTDPLYLATLDAARLALDAYPSIRWLLRHADISPRSRPQCPGDRWVTSGRFRQLASDLKLKTLI